MRCQIRETSIKYCINSVHDVPRQLIVVKNTLNPKIG